MGLDPNESFPGIKMDDLEAACSIDGRCVNF